MREGFFYCRPYPLHEIVANALRLRSLLLGEGGLPQAGRMGGISQRRTKRLLSRKACVGMFISACAETNQRHSRGHPCTPPGAGRCAAKAPRGFFGVKTISVFC